MLLPAEASKVFTGRERRQGRHLRKALVGRYQKSFRHPQRALKPLQVSARKAMNAHNAFARALWFRALGAELCRHLGAEPPHWIPKRPVYLVTLIDRKHVVDDGEEGFTLSTAHLDRIRHDFYHHLRGISFVGMIDVALFVSTKRVYGVPRRMLPHGHFLVWGIGGKTLDDICQQISLTTHALLPYGHAADYRRVGDRDLRQVLWYACKMPRMQYQVWKRTKGLSLKQYKRKINGVNSVRLFKALQHLTLEQLSMAGGEGVELRRRAIKRVQR